MDKEASEAKRRKDSPRDDSSISSSSPQPDTKVDMYLSQSLTESHTHISHSLVPIRSCFHSPLQRRVVKVGSKKEGSSRLQEVSPLTKKVKPESQKVFVTYIMKVKPNTQGVCYIHVHVLLACYTKVRPMIVFANYRRFQQRRRKKRRSRNSILVLLVCICIMCNAISDTLWK